MDHVDCGGGLFYCVNAVAFCGPCRGGLFNCVNAVAFCGPCFGGGGGGGHLIL